jgi:hypothetical protein
MAQHMGQAQNLTGGHVTPGTFSGNRLPGTSEQRGSRS